jgi:6-pyruvoyl-tetrahydropterin synthase
MSQFQSTKIIELGSCAFRQPNAASNRPNAGNNSQRCSYVHGYQLKAKFWFGCNELDDKNWAVDFGALKELKSALQHQFDHTLCIDAKDPLLPLFEQLHQAGGCDLRVMQDGVGIERTAEFCYKLASEHIKNHYGDRCWVERVEVFEHEENSVVYTGASNLADTKSPPAFASDVLTESSPATVTPTQPTQQSQRQPIPAHVGPNVSTGKGDWFKGTSWG